MSYLFILGKTFWSTRNFWFSSKNRFKSTESCTFSSSAHNSFSKYEHFQSISVGINQNCFGNFSQQNFWEKWITTRRCMNNSTNSRRLKNFKTGITRSNAHRTFLLCLPTLDRCNTYCASATQLQLTWKTSWLRHLWKNHRTNHMLNFSEFSSAIIKWSAYLTLQKEITGVLSVNNKTLYQVK